MPAEASDTNALLPSRLVKWTPAFAVGHYTSLHQSQVWAQQAQAEALKDSYLHVGNAGGKRGNGERVGEVVYGGATITAEVDMDPTGTTPDWQLWSFTYDQVKKRKGGKRIDSPMEEAA